MLTDVPQCGILNQQFFYSEKLPGDFCEQQNGYTDLHEPENTTIDYLEAPDESINKNKRTYHLLPIPVILIILYTAGCILTKQKIITRASHRKIWNILLLLSFFLSGISGIILIIEINMGVIIPLRINILFWHVEFGIAMFVISIFHILWHWPYYKNIFKHKVIQIK